MTDALFLAAVDGARVGDLVTVEGDEGRHAVSVRRIRVGETVFVSDGEGHGIHGEVVETGKSVLHVRVNEVLTAPVRPVRYVAVQALAKGDRAELAVETMTEVGIDEIVPWRSSRAVVKWDAGERGTKQLGRWQSTAREATKQSRRLRMPVVSQPATTAEVCERIRHADAAFVLHESAAGPLADQSVPTAGEVLFIIGPEGGISPDELTVFTEAGAVAVLVADAVLRTSTAGVVALAQLQAKGVRA